MSASITASQNIVAAIREALDLLGRASADWQNGTAAVPGPLHWPVAVNLARRELATALEALGTETAENALAGSGSDHFCPSPLENYDAYRQSRSTP